MNTYDIVYDEAIVSYLELYCFLGAYFHYTVSSQTERERAVNEVAEFCTQSFIKKVISQIDDLLVNYKTADDTLLEWLSRVANGRDIGDAERARDYLRSLQTSLKEALGRQHSLKLQPAIH